MLSTFIIPFFSVHFHFDSIKQKRTSRLITSPAYAPTETILIRPLHNREPHQYHQSENPNRASLGRYMVLPPIVVDRRFHIFMNSIPYPKGSLNVLIAHFGTFSCKCGIRTEINSLFIRGGANEGNQIATAAESFCGFFTPIFKISCSRLWKNTLARRCRQQREKCKAAVERVRGSLRANQQRERMPSSLRNVFLI